MSAAQNNPLGYIVQPIVDNAAVDKELAVKLTLILVKSYNAVVDFHASCIESQGTGSVDSALYGAETAKEALTELKSVGLSDTLVREVEKRFNEKVDEQSRNMNNPSTKVGNLLNERYERAMASLNAERY